MSNGHWKGPTKHFRFSSRFSTPEMPFRCRRSLKKRVMSSRGRRSSSMKMESKKMMRKSNFFSVDYFSINDLAFRRSANTKRQVLTTLINFCQWVN